MRKNKYLTKNTKLKKADYDYVSIYIFSEMKNKIIIFYLIDLILYIWWPARQSDIVQIQITL